MRTTRSAPLLLVVGALLLAVPALAAPQEGEDGVSAAVCADCHDPHPLGPHAALDTEGLAARAGAEFSCAACHGDPTQHLEEGGGAETMLSFGPDDPANVKSQACMTCHADANPRFHASPHFKAGLACTDCHSVHQALPGARGQLKISERSVALIGLSASSAACVQCHKGVASQFEFNERHRLQEGILECSSCHNPHEPASRWQLGGFKQQACLDCHTDKGGPFVYEHGSVRVEGCVACHTPHGSPNRHMLTFQNQAELCYSCHNVVPGFHAPPRFTSGSQCTNCHSSIHGSNFSPVFLK